jgi:hypothetical protein
MRRRRLHFYQGVLARAGSRFDGWTRPGGLRIDGAAACGSPAHPFRRSAPLPAFPFNMFSPFSQAIERFIYDPTTNWQGAFSPSIVFNANPQDAPIEAHVLGEVGSYGKQLGILIRVVDLLQTRIKRDGLDETELAALKAFDTLRDDASAAADEFRSRITADDILEQVKTFGEHKTAFERQALRDKLDKVLGG